MFYVVRWGTLDVLKNGKVVDTISDGDCVGELALVLNTPRNATITAKTSCTVWAGMFYHQL